MAAIEPGESAADDVLRVPEAVGGGGVDPVDPELERAVDRRARLLVFLGSPAELPVAPSNRPGAEADPRDLETGVAQLRRHDACLIHVLSFHQRAIRDQRLHAIELVGT